VNNIALVGFMGTGKTTIACMLAEKLNLEYLDLDELIVQGQNMSIVDIFAEKGEPFFRKIEKSTVIKVSAMHGKVIACGGGVVLDDENIKNLKRNGVVICLAAAPEVILERTRNYKHRPLLNVSDPKAKIKEMLNKRQAYYDKADYTVDTSGIDKQQVVDRITEWLRAKKIIEA
jgi:shikimate kinase